MNGTVFSLYEPFKSMFTKHNGITGYNIFSSNSRQWTFAWLIWHHGLTFLRQDHSRLWCAVVTDAVGNVIEWANCMGIGCIVHADVPGTWVNSFSFAVQDKNGPTRERVHWF